MPEIFVTAGSANVEEGSRVMLRERVNATDFESERFAANLLERLGWAVEDATEAERDWPRAAASRPASAAPERDPEPVGVA